jgi:hypothetical protein
MKRRLAPEVRPNIKLRYETSSDIERGFNETLDRFFTKRDIGRKLRRIIEEEVRDPYIKTRLLGRLKEEKIISEH